MRLSNREAIAKVTKLNNFWVIDPLKTSDEPGINVLIDLILEEMKQSGIPIPSQHVYKKKLQENIKVILCNLIHAYHLDIERYIGFSRDSGFYKDKNSKLSYENVKKVTDFLKDHNYIEFVLGHPKYKEYRQGHLSRMKATPKLIELIDAYKITEDMVKRDISNTETIIVKGLKPKPRFTKIKVEGGYKLEKTQEKRKIVATPNTKAVREMRRKLHVINQVLANAKISLDMTKEELTELNAKLTSDWDPYKTAIDPTKATLHRVFLDGKLDKGGRFYGGWWQNIPKEARKRILIDGFQVDEPDFSAYHPRILYALKRLKYPDNDPYELEGYSTDTRTFLKRLLLIMLNTTGKTQEAARRKAIKRIEYDVSIGKIEQPEEVKDIDALIDKFIEKHQPVQEYFFTGFGTTLMYIDSQIAEAILFQHAQEGIPVLPVHDSFIIDYRLSESMQDCMVSIYDNMFSQPIPTSSNISDLEMYEAERFRSFTKSFTDGPETVEFFEKTMAQQIEYMLEDMRSREYGAIPVPDYEDMAAEAYCEERRENTPDDFEDDFEDYFDEFEP